MTQKSYQGEVKAERETVAQKLMYKFSAQLGRLSTSIEDLERIGHRVANTNYPKPEESEMKVAAQVQHDGFLSELEVDLNRLESHNVRLEELVKKLSELI